jgi:hypothetical protein
MQPLGDLYIQCGLVFFKNWVIQFWNDFLVGSSQKDIYFLRLENKKYIFVQRQ